jgi:hypothetical protein
MGLHLTAQSRSCRAPALGATFARTLSTVESFMNALLNEMLRVILDPMVREELR